MNALVVEPKALPSQAPGKDLSTPLSKRSSAFLFPATNRRVAMVAKLQNIFWSLDFEIEGLLQTADFGDLSRT
ncbi:MAG: hypothetical protein NTX70_09890 [Verrucomicrobia bacterium]|nr:hypothetical protein [Verrucomicrobiota bacterium]